MSLLHFARTNHCFFLLFGWCRTALGHHIYLHFAEVSSIQLPLARPRLRVSGPLPHVGLCYIFRAFLRVARISLRTLIATPR